MIRQFTKSLINQQKYVTTLRYKTTSSNATLSEKEIENLSGLDATEVMEDNEELKFQEIEQKRNKSRLRYYHQNLVNDKLPYSEPFNDFHKTVKYQRKMYAIYGQSSQVDPSICWPTSDEIKEIKEYETIAFPYTIKETMEKVAQQKKEREDIRQKRQEDICKKFAKLEQWKKELNDRIAKKEAEARIVKERKDRLVEEVRRHFGFKIDPRDERFKEMLEQKEKAEKKALKEAKRKQKEAKLIAKLQEGKTATSTETVELNTKDNKETESTKIKEK